MPNFYSRLSLTGPGHPVLSWAKCFCCGLPSLSIKVVYSYADSCLSFIISIKLFPNEVPHKCTVGDQNGSFASINAYKGVALTADVLCRAAVGVKQMMHPAADDKSLLRLLRSFVCSQGPNKEETLHL